VEVKSDILCFSLRATQATLAAGSDSLSAIPALESTDAHGKRTDLRKGAPVNLTWTEWVQSKRHKLGRSLRTIQYMLRGKTEASRERQMLLAQRHAGLRSEPDSPIPHTPMEISSEMARLVLAMRDGGRNRRIQQRLEFLAEHLLRIIAQEKEPDSMSGLRGTETGQHMRLN